MTFTVSAPKVGVKGQSFEYDFGENVQDAIQKFGEDIVFKLFRQQAVVRAQALCRNHLTAGKSPEEVQQILAQWKPDAPSRTAKSPIEKIANMFTGLSPEEKEAVLAKMREQL